MGTMKKNKECPVCHHVVAPVIHYDYSHVTDGGGEVPWPRGCHCPKCKVMFMDDTGWREISDDPDDFEEGA